MAYWWLGGWIPHAPIYLSVIRTSDIWLLLAVGASYEFLIRLYLIVLQLKPAALKQTEQQLKLLTAETIVKRKMGPSAFVETSKLERRVLALEKQVQESNRQRKESHAAAEKMWARRGTILLALAVWILYYAVPVVTVEGIELSDYKDTSQLLGSSYVSGGTFLTTLYFPVSKVGMGCRISRFGLPKELVANSLGALMVLWSAQVTVGKLMDAVEIYCLL